MGVAYKLATDSVVRTVDDQTVTLKAGVAKVNQAAAGFDVFDSSGDLVRGVRRDEIERLRAQALLT